jgi:hypothetical protein
VSENNGAPLSAPPWLYAYALWKLIVDALGQRIMNVNPDAAVWEEKGMSRQAVTGGVLEFDRDEHWC